MMKLNPDCIRDVLLWIEENQKMEIGYNDFLTGRMNRLLSKDIPQYISDYSAEDVLYSVNQMVYSELLLVRPLAISDANVFCIEYIAPKGHEFLENIRSNDNWEKTKSIATKVGASTLRGLSTIATKLIAEIISKTINPAQ